MFFWVVVLTFAPNHIPLKYKCSRYCYVGSTSVYLNLRLADLMWCIPSIGHLYMSGIWQGLYSWTNTKKTFVTMRLTYVLKNIDIILNWVNKYNLSGEPWYSTSALLYSIFVKQFTWTMLEKSRSWMMSKYTGELSTNWIQSESVNVPLIWKSRTSCSKTNKRRRLKC